MLLSKGSKGSQLRWIGHCCCVYVWSMCTGLYALKGAVSCLLKRRVFLLCVEPSMLYFSSALNVEAMLIMVMNGSVWCDEMVTTMLYFLVHWTFQVATDDFMVRNSCMTIYSMYGITLYALMALYVDVCYSCAGSCRLVLLCHMPLHWMKIVCGWMCSNPMDCIYLFEDRVMICYEYIPIVHWYVWGYCLVMIYWMLCFEDRVSYGAWIEYCTYVCWIFFEDCMWWHKYFLKTVYLWYVISITL